MSDPPADNLLLEDQVHASEWVVRVFRRCGPSAQVAVGANGAESMDPEANLAWPPPARGINR